MNYKRSRLCVKKKKLSIPEGSDKFHYADPEVQIDEKFNVLL